MSFTREDMFVKVVGETDLTDNPAKVLAYMKKAALAFDFLEEASFMPGGYDCLFSRAFKDGDIITNLSTRMLPKAMYVKVPFESGFQISKFYLDPVSSNGTGSDKYMKELDDLALSPLQEFSRLFIKNPGSIKDFVVGKATARFHDWSYLGVSFTDNFDCIKKALNTNLNVDPYIDPDGGDRIGFRYLDRSYILDFNYDYIMTTGVAGERYSVYLTHLTLYKDSLHSTDVLQPGVVAMLATAIEISMMEEQTIREKEREKEKAIRDAEIKDLEEQRKQNSKPTPPELVSKREGIRLSDIWKDITLWFKTK